MAGILGTGICFTDECKAEAAADANLKNAQAAALSTLGQQKPQSNTLLWVIIAIVVLVIIVGVILLLRRKK